MARTKRIEAVELQHKGGESIRKDLEGLSEDEVLKYWKDLNEKFRREHEEAIAKRQKRKTPAHR
ncbi:MAG: hypothetical protein FJ319_01670 [SAR202 cluster bacterium]|nr:hypothetical protein [SAR202 cluster bacterium]